MLSLKRIKDNNNLYNWNEIKEKRIFLVGSARFSDYFLIAETILQLYYHKLVSMCSFYSLMNKINFSEKDWNLLQQTAIGKIGDCEAILVIDSEYKDEIYIGDHTKEELFVNNTIPIYYLSLLQKKEEKEKIDKNIKYKVCKFRFEIKEDSNDWKNCPHHEDAKSLSVKLLCSICNAFVKDINAEENRPIQIGEQLLL